MKCPKCGYEGTEPEPEENEKVSINMVIILALIATVVVVVCSANYLEEKSNEMSDEITYSGGCHIAGSCDSNVWFFQSNEVWYMIIPEITENGTVDNSLPYRTYCWNETRWVLK